MTARIVLAGNNLAAAYVLDQLLDEVEPAEVLAIAPPHGVHHSWQCSLAEHARARRVECVTPPDVNAPQVVDLIRSARPELLLSVYYTQIFRPEIIDAVLGPCLNFHPSLLPRHRGTAPIIWAIVEGDEFTGVTVHHIDPGIDTGDVVVQRPIPIHPRDTGYDQHGKMALLVRASAAELLRRHFSGAGIPAGGPQRGDASFHSSRDPALNHIDWAWGGQRIRNVVRALAPPLPGAYVAVDGQRFVLSLVEPTPGGARAARPLGMVTLPRAGPPLVWASDGPIAILEFVHDGVAWPGNDMPLRLGVAEGNVLA